MSIKFSIITVTYNAAKVLERTIQSVEKQEDASIEYLIIDGKSEDATLDIVSQNENCVNYCISESDNGLYDAMNKGMRQATGDYLLFLNAGDSLRGNDAIAKIAQIAEKENFPDILYGETDLVDDNGQFIAHRRLKAPEHLTWKSFRMGMLVCHQAFIVKRTLAPEYDTNYRYSADFDWCIRCMKAADTIVNTHLRFINYLNEGVTTANCKTSLKERYRIMQNYYGKFPVFLLHIWFAARFYWARLTKGVV